MSICSQRKDINKIDSFHFSMSNKFDAYDDNDEITLSSSSSNSKVLQDENKGLKEELFIANRKIKEYEEVINNGNVKDIKSSSLSEDDIFKLPHKRTLKLPTD